MSCDCNTLVVGEAGPQGPQGLAGTNGTNGTNGINAFTTVATSSYTQPAVNSSVNFNVANNQWIAVGQAIYVSQAGYYQVSTVSGSNAVTAILKATDGVNPGGTVAVGKKVSPAAVATYAAPLSTLTVSGTSIFSNGPVSINTSGATANDVTIGGNTDASLFVADVSTNRIGIGTSSPAAKLHISGDLQVGVGLSSGGGSLAAFTKGATFNSLYGGVGFTATNVTVKTQNVEDTFVVNASSDRVGVGTSSPARLLDVDGIGQTKAWFVNTGGASVIDGTEYVMRVLGSGAISSLVVNASTNFVGVNVSSPTTTLDVAGSTKISGNVDVSTSAFVVRTSGNYVGVNTSSPTTNLHVNGSGFVSGNFSLSGVFVGSSSCSVSSLTVTGSTNLSTLVATSTVNVDSGVLYVDTSNNRVGINTASPSRPLSVVGVAGFSGDVYVGGSVYVDTDVFVVDIVNNRVGINISSPTASLHVSGDTLLNKNLTVSNSLVVNTSTLVVAAASGTVGINTASPSTSLKLHVSGATQASSYQIASGTPNGKLTNIYYDDVALVSTTDLTSLTGSGTYQTYSHTVTGVASGDFANVTYLSATSNFKDDVLISAYCTTNTVNLVFYNMSATDYGGTTASNITVNILVFSASGS